MAVPVTNVDKGVAVCEAAGLGFCRRDLCHQRLWGDERRANPDVPSLKPPPGETPYTWTLVPVLPASSKVSTTREMVSWPSIH